MAGEPPLDTGLLVRRHIVEDDVDLAARIGPGEEVEKVEELGGPVLGRGAGRDGAGGDLEGGRQDEGAVTLVVVGVALDLPGPEGQHRLGPIERLDLGLLVDREDDRSLGRGEIQPDHVGHLRHELGIPAELERLGPMGLEAALPPDPQDRVRADPDGLRQAAGAPVGRPLRWGEGRGQDPLADLPAIDRRPARPRAIGKAGETAFPKAGPPQAHRRDGDAKLGGDRDVGDPFGCPQDDLRPQRRSLLGRARAGHRPQRFSFGLAHSQRRRGMIGHAEHRSCERPNLQAYCRARH